MWKMAVNFSMKRVMTVKRHVKVNKPLIVLDIFE